MRVWGVILVLTVVGGLTGAYWIGRGTRHSLPVENASIETDPLGSSNPSDIQEIHSNIAELEAALAEAQERLKRMEATKARPAEVTPPPAAKPKQPPRPTRQEIAEEYEFRARTFDSEPREETWAKREEERISSAAKASLPAGARIENGSCRTSLCKYDVAFPGAEGRQAFRGEFLRVVDSEGILGYNFQEPEQRPDGTYPVQLLVFRRGYPMPGDRGTGP